MKNKFIEILMKKTMDVLTKTYGEEIEAFIDRFRGNTLTKDDKEEEGKLKKDNQNKKGGDRKRKDIGLILLVCFLFFSYSLNTSKEESGADSGTTINIEIYGDNNNISIPENFIPELNIKKERSPEAEVEEEDESIKGQIIIAANHK